MGCPRADDYLLHASVHIELLEHAGDIPLVALPCLIDPAALAHSRESNSQLVKLPRTATSNPLSM